MARSRRTYAEQQAVEAAKRHDRTARGECAQCGDPSPGFYWCRPCRDRRNARVARTKELKKRLKETRLAALCRDNANAIGLAS